MSLTGLGLGLGFVACQQVSLTPEPAQAHTAGLAWHITRQKVTLGRKFSSNNSWSTDLTVMTYLVRVRACERGWQERGWVKARVKLVFSCWVLHWHGTNSKQDHMTSSPLMTWSCSLATLCPHPLCSYHSCHPAHCPTIPHSGHPSPTLVHPPATFQLQTQTNTNGLHFCLHLFAFVFVTLTSPSPLTIPPTHVLCAHLHHPPVQALCIHSHHPTHLCPLLCSLHNLISSSAHSSVVQGYVEFLLVLLGGWPCDNKLVRLKLLRESKRRD